MAGSWRRTPGLRQAPDLFARRGPPPGAGVCHVGSGLCLGRAGRGEEEPKNPVPGAVLGVPHTWPRDSPSAPGYRLYGWRKENSAWEGVVDLASTPTVNSTFLMLLVCAERGLAPLRRWALNCTVLLSSKLEKNPVCTVKEIQTLNLNAEAKPPGRGGRLRWRGV